MQPPAEVEPAITRMIEQVLVLEHLVVDAGGAREVAAGEAHLAHRLDDRARVELGDVDMLDRGRQQLRLAGVVDEPAVLNCSAFQSSLQQYSSFPRKREVLLLAFAKKNSRAPAFAGLPARGLDLQLHDVRALELARST